MGVACLRRCVRAMLCARNVLAVQHVALVLRGGRAMWRIVHSVKFLDVRILDSG